MKNMKKLLQKAMVFTLAVAMLVGTPMSASAHGLSDIYKIEDQWGNNVDENGNKTNDIHGDPNVVGTVTSTNTETATYTGTRGLQFDEQIKGIRLSATVVELEYEDKENNSTVLTATATGESGQDITDEKILAQVKGKYSWKSSNTSVVALENPNKTTGETTMMKLVAKGAGEATVTVSLNDFINGRYIKAEAKATITVLQYADKLVFLNGEIEKVAYTGNALVLDEYVERQDETGKALPKNKSKDTLTYTVVAGEKYVALKNGILTLKKATENGDRVKIVASGKNTCSGADGNGDAVASFEIKDGVNATGLEYYKGESEKKDDKISKLTWLVNDGLTPTITAKVKGKKSTSKDKSVKEGPCTDKISWRSNDSSIVDIKTVKGAEDVKTQNEKTVGDDEPADTPVSLLGDKCYVTLDFKGKKAGTTQIIGTLSTGKSFKFTVTVDADLTSVSLKEDGTVYTGQIIDLNREYVDMQYFAEKADHTGGTNSGEFTAEGLIKWQFVKSDDNKNASKIAKINPKTGALEILADLTKLGDQDGIKIEAVASKVEKKQQHKFDASAGKNQITLSIEQMLIQEITVTKATDESWSVNTKEVSGKFTQDNTKKKDSIDVDTSEKYVLSASGKIMHKDGSVTDSATDNVNLAEYITWTTSNGKVIEVSKESHENKVYGVLKGLKKGSAKIKASAVGEVTKGNRTSISPIKVEFSDTINAPSHRISLYLKNKDQTKDSTSVAAKLDRNKNCDKQTITVKFDMEKGTTTKNQANKPDKTDVIDWTATHTRLNPKEGESKVETLSASKIALGKLQLDKDGYEIGDKFDVTATVRNTGAQNTITITIVAPTAKVIFKEIKEAGEPEEIKSEKLIDSSVPFKAQIEISCKNDPSQNGIADGIKTAGVASYTVSGAGGVFVKEESGKLTITPLKEGKVTIKFTLADGKTGNLKLKIDKKALPSWLVGIQSLSTEIYNMFK